MLGLMTATVAVTVAGRVAVAAARTALLVAVEGRMLKRWRRREATHNRESAQPRAHHLSQAQAQAQRTDSQLRHSAEFSSVDADR